MELINFCALSISICRRMLLSLFSSHVGNPCCVVMYPMLQEVQFENEWKKVEQLNSYQRERCFSVESGNYELKATKGY